MATSSLPPAPIQRPLSLQSFIPEGSPINLCVFLSHRNKRSPLWSLCLVLDFFSTNSCLSLPGSEGLSVSSLHKAGPFCHIPPIHRYIFPSLKFYLFILLLCKTSQLQFSLLHFPSPPDPFFLISSTPYHLGSLLTTDLFAFVYFYMTLISENNRIILYLEFKVSKGKICTELPRESDRKLSHGCSSGLRLCI